MTWSILLLCATAMLTTCLTSAETVDCGTLDCKNGATCYISDSGYKECNCTEGFGGPLCDQSSVLRLMSDITKETTLDAQKAEAYATKAQEMLQGQLGQNYNDIEGSAAYINTLAALLVEKTGSGATSGDDLTSLTQELAGMTSGVLTAASACASSQIPGCTLSAENTKDLVDKTEENLGNMLLLMLNVSVITEPLPINKDNISMTVFKSSGASLPSSYNTNYGELTLPYWETFQDSNKDQNVLLSLVSYKSNPYVHSSNKEEVGGSVLKINATKDSGEELKLEDPDDPAVLAVDMSSIFDDDSTWEEMEKFESVNGAFMIARNFNITLNAIIVEIKLKSIKVCTTYGKYSEDEPDEEDFDMQVITKGRSRIEDFRPDDLPVAFEKQILRITIINQNISEPMHPIVITVLCEDYKLGSFGLPIHEYRIAEVDLRFFDKVTGTWNQSDGLKANAAKGKSVGFKSNFFGTFSANALFIPPQPINFAAIFLNFHERLKSTPHFLVVSCFIMLLSILLSIPMMRMDKHDRFLWSNLPLVDNLPDASYSYDMIVYTDVRSAKYFTSKVYLELKGKNGRTGIRILQDGQRENFGRGTSSNFTMKTKEHLGQLKELKIWHNNSGDYTKWLLSRVIIMDVQTKERYIFFCGKWLSMDQDDGRTHRRLRPMATDIISGNDMFNELSKRNLFDDHLWLSMSMRPTYSCFTRVQRLWTLVALLFLSMITSAMWYDTPDKSGGGGIKIGPLKLNYKMVYVGFMSSVISILPSLIIMQLFKNRRVKRSKPSKRKRSKRDKVEGTFQNIDDLAELESIHSENPEEISKDACVPEYKCKQIGYDVSNGNSACIPNVGFTGDSFYAKILNSTQTTICPVTTNETINCNHDKKIENFQTSPGRKPEKDTFKYQTSPFNRTEKESYHPHLHQDNDIKNKINTGKFAVEDSETLNVFAQNKLENQRDNYEGYSCNIQMTNVNNFQVYNCDEHEDKGNKDAVKHKEVWVDTEKGCKQKCCGKNEGCLFPWWFIFPAYALILACIGSSSFFTFMYTLEWGPDKTGEWMMAFYFGTLENILLIEPIKVVVFALLVSCFFKRVALKYFGDNTEDQPNSSEDTVNYDKTDDGSAVSHSIDITPPLMPYPGGKEDDSEMQELKKKLLLDRRLNEKIKSWMYQFLYILVIGIICSHNIITASYYQNTELAETLTPTTKLVERSDIWQWLESQLLNATFPKWYYNNMVRPAYVQRFTQNTYNLKLGPVRIRQVRSKGSCVVNPYISDAVSICPQMYSLDTEETNNFCVDWVTFNETCFDENEETDFSFEYTPDSKTKSMTYSGTFATYSGGGYVVDLGPKQSLALSYIQKLKEGNWIDENTRAVFVEVLTYNANTRVFTHARVVIETPEIGGVFVTTDVWSANLYPYITSWDFVVLICQIIFILIIFIRLILWFVMVCKTKCGCCTSMMTWVRLLEIVLAIGAIASYIMRIDNTITAIETLFNNFGRFVSFEEIHSLEEVYTAMVAIVMFLVILELLKPLTFNYYFYLMRTSLAVAGRDLLAMCVWIIIPMIAFSILLYLYSGYIEESFRDLPNSFMTLLLILIGMTLSNKNQVNHTFITVVYCLYTLLMSMVFISIFISILSIGYNDVKSENQQDEEPFDAELSDHLFVTIANFLRSLIPKRKPKFVKEEEPRDLLLEKVNELDETIRKLNAEEIRYHKKLSQEMLTIKPPPVDYLHCLISWDNNKTILRYTNDTDKCVLEMTIPDQSLGTKIKISLSKGNRKTKNSFPFNVPENKRTSVFSIKKFSQVNTCLNMDIIDDNPESITKKTASEIFVSYDNCQTWEVCPTTLTYCIVSCENQIAFRTVIKKIPTNAVLLYGENTKKSQHGRFEISPQGGEYFICNKTIVVKVETESVTDTCSVTMKAVPFGIGPMVEVLISEDILKPIKITIPRYGDSSRDSTEMIVILKQGDNEWIKLNVLLDIRPDKFQFTLPISNVTKSIRTCIVVKQSEIGWVNRSQSNLKGKMLCTKIPEADVKGLFESNVISTLSANMSSDFTNVAKSLDVSDDEIESIKQNNSEDNGLYRKAVLQKWLERNKLDKPETIKLLDKALRELKETSLANWLAETEFRMRCASTAKHEIVQLIKAINLVSRFETVATQWKDLAETLNIDKMLVRNLESDLPRCSIEKCSIVLFRWYRKDSTVTLAKLKQVMEEKGYRAVAARLLYL